MGLTVDLMTQPKQGIQRIDYSEAEQMLRGGATQQDVADRFVVSQAAVSLAIKRGNIKGITYDRTKGPRSGVPWRPIKPEHRSRYLVKMLRAATQRDRGFTLNAGMEHKVGSFLRKADKGGWVVHYDPDTPDGFYRVARRAGIDTGRVRDPYGDDDGVFIAEPRNAPKREFPR